MKIRFFLKYFVRICSEQYEETAIDDDILNNNNDDIVDGKIQLECDEENISEDFKISITSPSQCREKLGTIRNLRYEYCESVLYLLKNATKKKVALLSDQNRMQIDLREKGEFLTFLKKEQPKFQKELDSPTAKKQNLLNVHSARK